MPKLVIAWWLGALLGACRATQPNATTRSQPTEAAPCEYPGQPGCTECGVEQPGPTAGERSCYQRRSAGDDYAEQAEHRNQGACPSTCRPCAACSRDRQKTYQQLRAKGCDCSDPFVREIANGIDPCYSDGCGCTCSQLERMSECGPPF